MLSGTGVDPFFMDQEASSVVWSETAHLWPRHPQQLLTNLVSGFGQIEGGESDRVASDNDRFVQHLANRRTKQQTGCMVGQRVPRGLISDANLLWKRSASKRIYVPTRGFGKL